MSERKDDIEKYLRGELSPKEMHELEKRALSDPFLADAIEGGMSAKEDFSFDVKDLNNKIHKKPNVTLRIAAAIVVLISVSLFFIPRNEKQEQLAKLKTPDTSLLKSEKKEQQELSLKNEDQATGRIQKQKRHITPTVIPSPIVTSLLEHDTTTVVQVEPVPVVAMEKTHIISGVVTTDEDNLPLPGVTVVIKGTTLGTTTDVEGRYSLDVADTTSLLFSFVGMQTKEIVTIEKSNADVKMKEDVSQLSEVVIARTALPNEESEEPLVKLAEPVGGLRAYDKYLLDQRRYPQQALDNDVKGKVIVGFEVGINGELSNFKIIRSLGFGCDEEVVRLVKDGPNWKPTTEDSKPVESTVHVKVKFDASKYKKRKK